MSKFLASTLRWAFSMERVTMRFSITSPFCMPILLKILFIFSVSMKRFIRLSSKEM